jgi:hypothetical protein
VNPVGFAPMYLYSQICKGDSNAGSSPNANWQLMKTEACVLLHHPAHPGRRVLTPLPIITTRRERTIRSFLLLQRSVDPSVAALIPFLRANAAKYKIESWGSVRADRDGISAAIAAGNPVQVSIDCSSPFDKANSNNWDITTFKDSTGGHSATIFK